MRVIAKKVIVDFYKEHPDAKTALEEWYKKTEKADWDTFPALRKTFNSADNVGNRRVIFNIKGNNYRLVAVVLFKIKRIYIRFLGTHEEYDKLTADKIKTI